MRPDRIMIAAHSLALGFAFAVALFCPRPGAPALLMPLGTSGMEAAIRWVESEDSRFLLLDTAGARVVAPVPSHGSLVRALAAGIIPIAANGVGCAETLDGDTQWRS